MWPVLQTTGYLSNNYLVTSAVDQLQALMGILVTTSNLDALRLSDGNLLNE